MHSTLNVVGHRMEWCGMCQTSCCAGTPQSTTDCFLGIRRNSAWLQCETTGDMSSVTNVGTSRHVVVNKAARRSLPTFGPSQQCDSRWPILLPPPLPPSTPATTCAASYYCH